MYIATKLARAVTNYKRPKKYHLSQGRIQGGSLGSRDPPPEIYQRSQKNDVLV